MTSEIKNTCGLLYIATGLDYLEEASVSARSFREKNSGVPICIITDQAGQADGSLFDEVIGCENPHHDFFDKIEGLRRSPFERTIFLDTDTRAIHAIVDLFELLASFDLAVAFDPIRSDFQLSDVPDSFPTPNTGVIAYRNTQVVRSLFDDWGRIYQAQLQAETKPLHDQPAFRKALYTSSVRFTILPDEYNLRVIFQHMVGGNAKIKILHGRHHWLADALKYADTVHFYPRVYGRQYEFWELLRMAMQRGFERAKARTFDRWLKGKRIGKRTGVKLKA